MKILFITPSYKPAVIYGGPTYSVSKLAEHLSKKCSLQVVTTTANGKLELEVSVNKNIMVENVNVYYFKRQTKDHTHFSFQLLKYIWNNSSQFDVIHIHSWWNLVSIFSLCICLINNSKVLISPRGMLSEYTIKKSKLKSIVNTFFNGFLYNKVHFHLTSKYEYKQVNDISSISKHLIPNLLIDKSFFKSDFENKNDILFLSRIEKKKNIEELIYSIPKISMSINLNIVGGVESKYREYLQTQIQNLNIQNRVSWYEPLYNEHKNKIIANSKLLILPSYDENFANIVLEALLNGTAVVVSENVGLSDFVSEFNLGWVVKSDGDLSEIINNALNDIDKLKFIYHNSREIVLREFNDEKIVQQYLSMYTSIISNV